MIEFQNNIEIINLKREEIVLLTLIRELQYGTLEITVQDGKPTMIKKLVKSIKL